MFIISSFDEKKNIFDYYRGQDCIEELCKKLKKSAIEIIYYEKKKVIIPLNQDENNSYNEQEI